MLFQATQLRTFLTVIEHGSLRAAADVLGVSPAAVSSSLATLAAIVGVPLFARKGRGVNLTAAGLSFANDARRIMALSEGSIVSARAAAMTVARPLRIGTVGAASEMFLGSLLACFMKRAPDIPVEVEVVRRNEMWGLLERREIDLGFVEVPPFRPELRLLAMRSNDYIVAAPAGRRYDRSALEQSLWLLREPGAGTRTEAEDFLREYGIAPSTRSLGANAAIIRCVAAGVGVSLLAKDIISYELSVRAIQVVRTPFTPRPRPWFLITTSDRKMSDAMNRFLLATYEAKFTGVG